MRATSRLATATGILAIIGTGLYACSSTSEEQVPEEGVSKPATPTGSETGTDPIPDASDKDTNQTPARCAILESKAPNVPTIEPAACKRCAAERCCGQLTKCYTGAKPADAGPGGKTICQLYGECEDACSGNPVCEAQCGVTFGEPAANDWSAIDACISGAAPSGCHDLCN